MSGAHHEQAPVIAPAARGRLATAGSTEERPFLRF